MRIAPLVFHSDNIYQQQENRNKFCDVTSALPVVTAMFLCACLLLFSSQSSQLGCRTETLWWCKEPYVYSVALSRMEDAEPSFRSGKNTAWKRRKYFFCLSFCRCADNQVRERHGGKVGRESRHRLAHLPKVVAFSMFRSNLVDPCKNNVWFLLK